MVHLLAPQPGCDPYPGPDIHTGPFSLWSSAACKAVTISGLWLSVPTIVRFLGTNH